MTLPPAGLLICTVIFAACPDTGAAKRNTQVFNHAVKLCLGYIHSLVYEVHGVAIVCARAIGQLTNVRRNFLLKLEQIDFFKGAPRARVGRGEVDGLVDKLDDGCFTTQALL